MTKPIRTETISRRRFLRVISAMTAGSLLCACAVGPENPRQVAAFEPHVTDVRLPSSQANRPEETQANDQELTRFLTLSALLTGVDELDPALGQIYLQSLQAPSDLGASVGALLEQTFNSTSPISTTLEELEERGIFQDSALRAVADKITEYWYTGIYTNADGEETVATYVDALAWKTLTFTKPMTVCGSYRFWTEPPEAAID
jgi:hypothetical protein